MLYVTEMKKEKAVTTVRLRPSTLRALKALGRKGETYDQIIRRRLTAGIDFNLLKRLRKAESEPSIPENQIPWNEFYKMSEEEFDELIKALGSAQG
jgi:hypothetical protein